MWRKVICLAVTLVTMAYQGSAQPPPENVVSAKTLLDAILAIRKVPPDTCCSGPYCNGQCHTGYCPYPLVQSLPAAYCRCPTGKMCCIRKVPPKDCRQCNSKARCVPLSVQCPSGALIFRECPCPKGQQCCEGPFCFECGGTCMPQIKCTRPYYSISSEKCPCPKDQVCCKRQTCGYTTACTRGVCVPNLEKCLYPFNAPWVDERSPILVKGCTCPPKQKCCRFNCPQCGGMCIRKECPSFMKQIVSAKCGCREGFVCCRGDCQHGACIPIADCIGKLGGWAVPATNCPKGLVCCQRPTCENLKACKNASCVDESRCKAPNIINSKTCTCRPGKVCCRLACTLHPCNAKCVKGVCDAKIHMMSMNPEICPCPDGYSCCKEGTCETNCPGAQCRPKTEKCASPVRDPTKCTCPHGQQCCQYSCKTSCNGACIKGWCIPPMTPKPNCNCPEGSSCCTVPCKHKPCFPKEECDKDKGTVVMSTDCPKDTVCCKGSCECHHQPCITPKNCKLSGGVPVPSSNCVFGRVCCKINARKCPYSCVTGDHCKALGGVTILASNCFRPLLCCKYKLVKLTCKHHCIGYKLCKDLNGHALDASDCPLPNTCCLFEVSRTPKCTTKCSRPEDCVRSGEIAVASSGCPTDTICCVKALDVVTPTPTRIPFTGTPP